MTFARGVAKTIAIAEETTLGVQSVASGQKLRRVSADFNLNIQPIESQEILPSQQVRDYRNGPRQVAGNLSGQLSPASYKMIFEGLLRKEWVAGVDETGLTDTALTNTTPGTSNITLVSTGTNWLTAGFKVGDTVRITGASGPEAVTNNRNLRVVNITASPHTMTFAPNADVVGWASGETITVAVVGKKLWVPATGQIYKSYTIEQWFSDIATSELYLGCRATQMSLNIPASGFVTFQAGFVGLNQPVDGSSEVYSSAAAATSTISLTAVDGKLTYEGVDLAFVTGVNLQIAPEIQTTPVVGSNILPEIFIGTLRIRGSLTALLQDAAGDTLTEDFLSENDVTLTLHLTTTPDADADFVTITLPRVRLSSSTKSDSDRAIMRQYNFVALEKVSGAGTGAKFDATSIVLQDSLA
jgi:hypothetical protein